MRDGRFRDSELWKWIKAIIEVAVLFGIIIGVLCLLQTAGLADEEYEVRYVLCMDRLTIRMGPSRSSCEIGWLECGDLVYIDGKAKNGYVHCVGLNIEDGEGWVHKGYLVCDRPVRVGQQATIVSKGRLKARKYVDGKRTRWLKSGAKLKVHWWSEEWCLTECGYVQSQYLEIGGD